MNKESQRTSIFLGIAVVCCLFCGLIFWLTAPRTSDEFALNGKPFFETFDPAKATSMQVSARGKTGELQVFEVRRVGKTWVIPSHHNYPAEAAERLASTTAALMGLNRDAVVGRLPNTHSTYGVLDPLENSEAGSNEIGTHITVKDENNNVLVDYIIGQRVKDDSNRPTSEIENEESSFFYVRRPDEKQTYKVEMDVDLSTRFTDWIKPDLLRITQGDIRSVVVYNYEVVNGGFKDGPEFKFTRDSDFGKWKLDGVDEQNEELASDKVDEIVTLFDQMKIVGVRPKATLPDGRQVLKADLSLNLDGFKKVPEQLQRRIIRQAAIDLQEQGFYLAGQPLEGTNERLFGQQGKVDVTTKDGVLYSVYFGDVFLGDTESIEIGGGKVEKVKSKSKEKDSDKKSGDPKKGDSKEDSPKKKDKRQKSRFVMVRVQFDESLLGEAPVKPTEPRKPVEPEGYKPADAKSEDDKKKDDKKQEAPKPPAELEKEKLFKKYEADLATYRQEFAKYQAKLQTYDEAMEKRNQSIKKGKKAASELHERFGPWYYVVAADKLDSLKIPREEFVKPKKVDPNDPKNQLPIIPDISFGDSNKKSRKPGNQPESGSAKGKQPAKNGKK